VPQTITIRVKELVEAAEREIATPPTAEAVALHGRDDVVFVDLRDIRELNREGRVPLPDSTAPRSASPFPARPSRVALRRLSRSPQENTP
jgi:hypothetical protein